MKAHFIGIGGIGMSALAQLYKARGWDVSGSDRDLSPRIEEMLTSKGVTYKKGHDATYVSEDTDLVVYSAAVVSDSEGCVERERAEELGVRQLSYFGAIGEVSNNMTTVAVAGTHGKTTTTAMLGKILIDAGIEPTVVVGSVVKDFDGSNFVEGKKEGPLVVEACEYQDHILKIAADILVVNNLEWDHTDYFKNEEALEKTFIEAIKKLPKNGALITDLTDERLGRIAEFAPCLVLNYPDVSVPDLKLIGAFNRDNAKAAKTAAAVFVEGLDEKKIDKSLAEFSGTWRRFEYIGETESGAFVYDDYAHHPTAVAKTLCAVRDTHPDKKLVVAFHPHLFTRTRDFMDEFAESLINADEVIVAPIFAAREEPIDGVTSEVLAKKIQKLGTPAQATKTLDDVLPLLKEHDAENTIIITMGAGNIYTITKQLV